MKQTNNAIKFLMAQYRAIFKNANIAMVAAMAAAALAAGSANAAQQFDGIWDLSDFSASNDGTGDLKAETVTKKSDIDMSKLEVGDVEAGTGFIYAGLKNKEGSGDNTVTTISGKEAVVTIKGAKDRSIAVAGLTLEKGASLTINNTTETDTRIFGYANGSGAAAGNMGAMVVDGSTIVGNKTAFQFNTVEIKNGSNITIGGILDTEKDNLKNGPEWSIYSNIGANTNGGTSGAISVKKSTITLNDESNLVGKDSVTLEGATINFAGKKHKDGFSTANIVGLTASTGEVVLDSGTKLNVNGYGAVYSDKITVKDASATINSGELFLDGMWTDSANSGNNKHNQSAIDIGALTVDGTGTLVLGNAASGGTTTISGSTVIKSKLVNNTAVKVSGASAVLELDAKNIKADTGLFVSKSGTLTISGGKLKLTNLSETLDLANAKQIKFAGTAAQNVVKVDTSGHWYPGFRQCCIRWHYYYFRLYCNQEQAGK